MQVSRTTYNYPVFRCHDPRFPIDLDPDPAFLDTEPLCLVRVEMRRRSPVGIGYLGVLLIRTLDRGPGTRPISLLELKGGAWDGGEEIGRDQAIKPFVLSTRLVNSDTGYGSVFFTQLTVRVGFGPPKG